MSLGPHNPDSVAPGFLASGYDIDRRKVLRMRISVDHMGLDGHTDGRPLRVHYRRCYL